MEAPTSRARCAGLGGFAVYTNVDSREEKRKTRPCMQRPFPKQKGVTSAHHSTKKGFSNGSTVSKNIGWRSLEQLAFELPQELVCELLVIGTTSEGR